MHISVNTLHTLHISVYQKKNPNEKKKHPNIEYYQKKTKKKNIEINIFLKLCF